MPNIKSDRISLFSHLSSDATPEFTFPSGLRGRCNYTTVAASRLDNANGIVLETDRQLDQIDSFQPAFISNPPVFVLNNPEGYRSTKIKNVNSGEFLTHYMQSELASDVVKADFIDRAKHHAQGMAVLNALIEQPDRGQLTRAELDVLRLALEYESVEKTTIALSIAPRTVERHRYNLSKKINMGSFKSIVHALLKAETDFLRAGDFSFSLQDYLYNTAVNRSMQLE